jgi:hypothetical protein
MPNPFAHIELSTDDVKKAKKFYQAVFAWKLTDMPAYTMIDVGGGVGGGMQNKPMPEAPTAWLPYVQVDDVKATMAKALKGGGTAVLPFQEIGEMGAIGIFVDPAGAMLGLWESKAPPAAPTPAKKKAPAKKAAAPAKKAPAKKAPAKKAAAPAPAPAKKAPAKKAAPAPAAKKAPAKKK